MGVRTAYRKMPTYIAIPLAILLAAVLAVGLAGLSVFLLDALLTKFKGPDALGAGVLVILVALNVAVMTFISLVSILVGLHHKTSWLTPTVAFVTCICLVRMMGPFDFQFTPFLFGTGLTVWLVSCWFLRIKQNSSRAAANGLG